MSFSMRRVHPGSGIQYGLFGEGVSRRLDPVVAGFIPSAGPATYAELATAHLDDVPGYVFAGPDFWESWKARADGEALDDIRAKHEALIENATHFVVQGLTKQPLALAIQSLPAAFETLDGCVIERLAEMGITRELADSTASHPTALGGEEWARKISRVYPREALNKGFDGTVEMRVVVGEDGLPTHFHVSDQMLARALREAACEAMLEHARFTPARNRSGSAIPGVYFQRVRYVIPARVNADGSA